MGNRFIHDRIEKIGGADFSWFTKLWVKPGSGKFWKRRYNKAFRRSFKQGSERGLSGKRSQTNWKNW